MTTYADADDLDEYFGNAEVLIAADRDGDGIADTDVITTGLTNSTEEIDSYVAVRYDLPLDAVPGVLVRVCCDLAMYHMSVLSTSMTDDKKERYKDAVRWLTNLSKGVVTLGEEEASESVQDDLVCSSSDPPRLFTRSKMSGLL